MSLRFGHDRVMSMESYQELMQSIRAAASNIFATAKTEGEVCELERMIYDEINRIAAAEIAKHAR